MKKIILSIVLLAMAGHLLAQHEVFIKSGQAINGYDAVAYFKESKAVKGKDEFSYHWKDADWFFSNAENLDAFKDDPEKYAPQFGGYCAYGMSEGHKASTEPEAWTIVDGKLYLNYNMNVLGLWRKDQQPRIKKANENWPTVKQDKD